jgi:hypothetical protein
MSKRLQVILDEEEMQAIQEAARLHRTTVAEWVRQALRAARRREPHTEATRKIAAIRLAAAHSFPAADIEQILTEIEKGYTENTAK